MPEYISADYEPSQAGTNTPRSRKSSLEARNTRPATIPARRVVEIQDEQDEEQPTPSNTDYLHAYTRHRKIIPDAEPIDSHRLEEVETVGIHERQPTPAGTGLYEKPSVATDDEKADSDPGSSRIQEVD